MANTQSKPPAVVLVSGGVGASGEQMVHTVLAQYAGAFVKVATVPNVRHEEQIDAAIQQAIEAGGVLVHTLVDADLRSYLAAQAARMGVPEIDLMGPLFEYLNAELEQTPAGQPGLYRQLNQDYFDRVAAIEYAMAHDDGKDPEGWLQAEILLVGVSRVGKTPLSLYLSVLGWKAANLPLVPELNLPKALFEVDPRRVVYLSIEPGQLLSFRKQRQRRLGVSGPSNYTHPEKVYEELQYGDAICRRGGFRKIDVTDRPIESSADEVVRLVTRQLGKK